MRPITFKPNGSFKTLKVRRRTPSIGVNVLNGLQRSATHALTRSLLLLWTCSGNGQTEWYLLPSESTVGVESRERGIIHSAPLHTACVCHIPCAQSSLVVLCYVVCSLTFRATPVSFAVNSTSQHAHTARPLGMSWFVLVCLCVIVMSHQPLTFIVWCVFLVMIHPSIDGCGCGWGCGCGCNDPPTDQPNQSCIESRLS